MLKYSMRFSLLLILSLLTLTFSALAQEEEDPNLVKDSIYFTLKDGSMSLEEMKEEADYVYKQCNSYLYQSRFFDCGCIAGAFLNEREKRGPTVLQEDILTQLFRTGGELAKCGNAPAIAGSFYKDCMEYAAVFRYLEDNNEQYCRCTGNRVANDFSEYPYLRTAYIERLRMSAMTICEKQYPQSDKYY